MSSKEDMYPLIIKLIVEQALNDMGAKAYIDWALDALEEGYDSKHLRILAGLSPTSSCADILPYFQKAVQELQLHIPETQQAFQEYAYRITQHILDNALPPQEGLDMLASLYSASHYRDDHYAGFYQLQEAIEVFGCDEAYYKTVYPGFAPEEKEDAIKEECRLYQAFLHIELPRYFFQMAYCRRCGDLDIPGVRQRWQWLPHWLYRRIFGTLPRYQSCCQKCGGQHLLFCRSIEGRKYYLTQQEGTPLNLLMRHKS